MASQPRQWFLHVFLILATFATATWSQGPVFAIAIMFILLAHELGHYFACRKHGVKASLPFFIPMPNILGTMGAVISVKSLIPSRKALFDIGIAGPLSGLVVAIPITVLGLYLSKVQPIPLDNQYLFLGEPLLFQGLGKILFGSIPEGHDIALHPLAFAGWAAFFITSINLIPIGQLDGGHLLTALLGKQARIVAWIAAGGLVIMGYFFQPMWFIFLALFLFFMFRDPIQPGDISPLGKPRYALGFLILFLFVITFSVVPFELRLN